MIKVILLFLIIYTALQGELMNYDIKPKWLKTSKYMGINILDSKELKLDNVSELSALAFKDSKLYGLGDRGYLYNFDFLVKHNKITKFKLNKAYRLRDKKGKKLKGKKRDSEGMVFLKDNLLISFERVPRVELFSTKAIKIKNKKIHKDLRQINNYKSKNKALESVAYNKKYGVITAPETALKKEDEQFHILYAKEKTWKFRATGKVTALEFITKDKILVLERSFNKLSRKRVIAITIVYLNRSKKGVCKSKVLAKFNSKKGWKIDNFEGMAKVDKNKFLIVSDDNDSFFQKTLLVLFEIRNN